MLNLAEKFNLRNLEQSLEGQRLQGFVPEHCFLNEIDYKMQTPSLYPLGQLHYVGIGTGRGMTEEWKTEFSDATVEIDPDGIVTNVNISG